MKPDQALNYLFPVAIIGVLLVVAKPLKALFEGLNVSDTEAEKENRKNVEQLEKSGVSSNYWAPRYYKELLQFAAKRKQKVNLLTVASADALCKRIYESVGTFTDKPAQGLSAFKQLKTKSQVSFLAERFSKLYRADLLGWLNEKYDTNAQQSILNQILAYTNSLSSGVIK